MSTGSFIRIVVAGEYTFHVGSNDGSRLRIDNKIITEMDQVQYYKEKAGTIAYGLIKNGF